MAGRSVAFGKSVLKAINCRLRKRVSDVGEGGIQYYIMDGWMNDDYLLQLFHFQQSMACVNDKKHLSGSHYRLSGNMRRSNDHGQGNVRTRVLRSASYPPPSVQMKSAQRLTSTNTKVCK